VPIPVLHEESRSNLQCLWLGIVGSGWDRLSREMQRAVGKEAQFDDCCMPVLHGLGIAQVRQGRQLQIALVGCSEKAAWGPRLRAA
jgi:hypothetical protein